MKPYDKIVYVDNHILVAVKDAEMATQPDFVDAMKLWIKEKYQKPGAVFLEPVHRLDKPVAGLVLFARTSKALSRLQAAMRERKIGKTYVALVDKMPSETQGTLRHFLVHDEFRARVDGSGKESILHYKAVGKNKLEITLETGRYHQIRAQLAAIGCPIRGDIKYGSKTSYSPGIALTHIRLELQHPVTKEKILCDLDSVERSSLQKLVADNPKI